MEGLANDGDNIFARQITSRLVLISTKPLATGLALLLEKVNFLKNALHCISLKIYALENICPENVCPTVSECLLQQVRIVERTRHIHSFHPSDFT